MKEVWINDVHITEETVDNKSLWEEAISNVELAAEYQQLSIDYFNKEAIEFKTSGSTGIAKSIKFTRSEVDQSAERSQDVFGYKKGDDVLMALPLRYVAGGMMLYRAWYSGLHLHVIGPALEITLPSSRKYRFAPLTAAQLSSSWEEDENFIHHFKSLLIGGGEINKNLENLIRESGVEVFHSYGMTETLTHVAIRRVGRDQCYTALKGVYFGQGAKGNLIIHTPTMSIPEHITTDWVDLLNDKQFIWRGRLDHIINSGGVKINPIELEESLESFFDREYVISCIPHEDLGEQVVLVVKGKEELSPMESEGVEQLLHFTRPKKVIAMNEIPKTETGKIDRHVLRSQYTKHNS